MKRSNRYRLRSLYRTFFHDRKLIVISRQGIRNYPLTGKQQFATLLVLVLTLTTASWFGGTYMAMRQSLKTSEEQVTFTNKENKKVWEQVALLKDYLLRLDEEGGALSDYDQYILSQYLDILEPVSVAEDSADHQDTLDRLQDMTVSERVTYLEQALTRKQKLVDKIREHTKGKIEELEAILSTTGLKEKNLVSPTGDRVPAPRERPQASGGPYVPSEFGQSMRYSEVKLLREIQRLVRLHEAVEQLPLGSPMHDAEITSGFGRRVDPFRKRWAAHNGIDFAGPVGSEIFSTADGTVAHAGRKGAYGNLVVIEHAHGISTYYGHLSAIKVQEGDVVKRGQLVGIQGSTGRSTGAHLHYEIHVDGEPRNPSVFLEAPHVLAEK